jgi:hypothetical protein
MVTPYDYQLTALSKSDEERKGQFVLPTGTGKTTIESLIIEKDINDNPNQFRFYLVNAPRIILSYQLLKEFYFFLSERNIKPIYHFTHSGNSHDDKDLRELRRKLLKKGIDIPPSKINATTSSRELVNVIENAKTLGVPLVVVSTLNSCNRVEAARRFLKETINIVINDEAHYVVRKQFHWDVIHALKSERTYFFTATRKTKKTDKLDSEYDGLGMNNETSYGKVLFELKPLDAIMMGKMLRPRLHIIKTKNIKTDEDFERSLPLVLLNSWNKHSRLLDREHNGLKLKLLITTRGSSDIKRFLSSSEYTELRYRGVDIFAVMSDSNSGSDDYIGYDINGRKIRSKQEWLDELKEYGEDKNKEIIVLHYDILTEGIDVPGLTSCMLLRQVDKSKFVQTYGRNARVHPDDRKMIDLGLIDPKNKEDLRKMKKPYGYVILPYITLTNKDDYESTKKIIREMRSVGFNTWDDVVEDFEPLGDDDDNDRDSSSRPDRRRRNVGTMLAITEILEEIETEEMASLSDVEYFNRYILNN